MRDNLITEAELFAIASEMESSSAREAYLNEACGSDLKLKERLLRLLSYSSTVDSFLETPPLLSDLPEGLSMSFESVGDVIGPYKLLQKIGEGGMGTVFMADQKEPVKRRVAIKVIKPGMDSAQVLSRFEAERQSLVMMDHPNIARALDVGTTDRGRPYFVMELVQGIPITRYCDENRIDTDKRLELFIPVCSAVQHAHLKGIIHRDLKPSNILVADYDDKAVPKVIDFGIAKAVDQQMSPRTMFTQLGQVVGTVEYMSPEQSRVNQLDVDTRSDVYSLGVVLYELLTGSTPIQNNRIQQCAWDELTRMIREDEPPAPSVRIGASENIANIAASRQSDPTKLNRLVRGELDWIVMKALEKDRSRRYQTPNELAMDVQRYLNNEAVVACPPSTIYQLKKLARRYRFAMLSGVLVTISLLMGLVSTLWQARQAREATKSAVTQRDIAKAESWRAQSAEKKALLSAELSKREAEISQAIGTFVNKDLLAFADPDVEPDRNIQLRTLLDRAAKSGSTLQRAPAVEAALRHTLATAYLNLGEYHDASEHADRALELRLSAFGDSHPDTLDSQLLVAEIQLKQSLFRESSKSFQEAVDRCRSGLGDEHSLTLRGLRGLGVAWFKQGRLDTAQDHLANLYTTQCKVLGAEHRDSLETRRELAELLFAKGHYRESLAEFSHLLEGVRNTLGETHPLTLKTSAGLATVLVTLGELEKASSIRKKIFASQSKILGAEHPETLLSASLIAAISSKSGRLLDAEQQLRQLWKTAEAKLGEKHLVTIELGSRLADVLCETGQIAESKQLYDQAYAAMSDLADRDNPMSLHLQFRRTGLSLFAGNYDEALSQYREVLEAQRSVLSPQHADPLHTQSAMIGILMVQGKYDECHSLLDELIPNAERSVGASHPIAIDAKSKRYTIQSLHSKSSEINESFRQLLAFCEQEHGKKSPVTMELSIALAESLERRGSANDALQHYIEQRSIAEEMLGKEHATTLRIQDSMANALQSLARYSEARKIYADVLPIRSRTLGDSHPLTLRSINNLGSCLVNLNELTEGEKLIRRAYSTSKEHFGPGFPATQQYGQNLASTLGLMKKGRESIELYKDIMGTQLRSLGEYHPTLLFTQMGLAGAYAHQGRMVEAEKLYRSVLKNQRQTLGESHPSSLRCLENLSVVVGQQHRYAEAVELGREYLTIAKAGNPNTPTTRKILHAIIEYQFLQGKTTEAIPYLQESRQLFDAQGGSLDWLINDLQFLAFDLHHHGEFADAISHLKLYADYCQKKHSERHPKTLLAQAMLASWLTANGKSESAKSITDSLAKCLESTDVDSLGSKDQGRIARATILGDLESLALVANDLSQQKSWLRAALLYGQCESMSNSSDRDSHRAMTYRQQAIEALNQANLSGMVASERELLSLTMAPELSGIRMLPEFLDIMAKMKTKLRVNHLSRLAWSHAMAGDHTIASRTTEELLAMPMKKEQKNEACYNSACVYSLCFGLLHPGEKKHEDVEQGIDAEECLKRAIDNLTRCFEDGYFENPGRIEQMTSDNDLDPIRGTEEFQAILRKIKVD
jgi:serine/threonine protein kinase